MEDDGREEGMVEAEDNNNSTEELGVSWLRGIMKYKKISSKKGERGKLRSSIS